MAEILPEHFTIDEIAEKLKYPPRKVLEAVYKLKIEFLGNDARDMRLNPEQVTALLQAMGEPCRSVSSNGQIEPGFGSKVELRATRNAYANALKATAKNSPGKRRQRSKLRSSARSGTGNVVALDPSPKRS
jgi:hypothetical protein